MKKVWKAAAIAAAVVAVLTVAALLFAKSMNASPREVVSGGKSQPKVYVEELSLIDGSDRIRGTVYKPWDSTGRKPLLIYCHGLGQTGAESDAICRLAAQKGYIAYNFDFRGGSVSSRSSGKVTDMSLKTEQEDLEFVMRRLSKKDFVDKKHIFVIGHSLGAAVAGMVAAEHPKKIEGAVLLAPAFNLPEMAEVMFGKVKDIPDSTSLLGYPVGKKFFTDLRGCDPYKSLKKFKGDVLIIHGSEDAVVPPMYAERAAKEYKNAELQIFDGVGHAFRGDAGNKMRAALGQWLENHNN